MFSEDRVSSSPPQPPPFRANLPQQKIGPFDVSRSPEELLLRLENRGELTIKGCFLLFFTMLCILAIGVMSVVETAQTPRMRLGVEDPSRLFAPTQNHFGFLWLVSSLLMFIAVPLYVTAVYRSALVYRFNRKEDAFYRGSQRVCRLRRVEYIRLSEEKDPDGNYLYMLRLVHSDGEEMLLHNGYDEREMMNLANAVGSFLETRIKWKQPAAVLPRENET